MTAAAVTAARAEQAESTVVCVDLDGTLIIGDLLWESFITLLKRRPARALRSLSALRLGKAHFKRMIAKEITINPAELAYREDLLEHLRSLYDQGTTLVMATASDEGLARAVAAHLGIFADVIASNGHTNLSGRNKAEALSARYGRGGFAYVGNSWTDVSVWRSAGTGIAVAAPPRLLRQGESGNFIHESRCSHPPRVKSVLRALRPHQWAKNLLVFVPVVAAHTIFQLDRLVLTLLTFIVFSLCASAVYVANDIADIDADRQHTKKRNRPFAAGHLSIPSGLLLSSILFAIGICISLAALSWQVTVIVLVYILVTSAYSLRLKKIPVVDVFTLTGLYSLRIVAGGIATATPLSSWLMAFALFLFLSLAFVKRYTELLKSEGSLSGRGYRPDDSLWMHGIGTSASYMAVVILALYVNAPETSGLYARPKFLWLLCPLLLFWVTRLWFRAGRRLIDDDPVWEALKDPVSYLIIAGLGVIVLAAM